jgi:Phage integrase family
VPWSVPISPKALIALAAKYFPIRCASRIVSAVSEVVGPLSAPCSARCKIPAMRAIAPAYFAPQSARHAVGPTKGRKARSVPVPMFVLEELSVQCKGKALDGLVFGGRDGGYLPRPKSSNGWFRGAVEAAGTQTITPHDLRHTCASLAVSAGVNVLALQRMLGHLSAKVTLDTYADLFDADLDAVSATLHTRYSPESVGIMWAQGALTGLQHTSKSPQPAQKKSEHQCGRRDSNPHALSSTGT